MKSLITELFYGNFDPQANGLGKNKKIKEKAFELLKAEKKLLKHLDSEGKKLYIKYDGLYSDLLSMSEADSFELGFITGMTLLMEVMTKL